MRTTRRSPRRASPGVLLLSLIFVTAAVVSPVATTGAFFTAATSVRSSSVGAATVSVLADGAASRDANGVAKISWTDPAMRVAPVYAISRTLDGVTSTLSPALSTSSGTTSFVDDLTTNATIDPAVLTGVSSSSAGGYTTCGIKDGAAYCWGDNRAGQVGDGTTTNRAVPTRVAGLATVSSVDAGYTSSCAITTTALLYCWGDNTYGQLGNGTSTSSRTPTLVAGLSKVTSVSVGYLHACAIADGLLYCWGQNRVGAVGDGTTTDRTSPTLVPLAGATSVAAGAWYTCAIANADLACWGQGGFGNLGNGDYADRLTPTAVTGLSHVTAVSAWNWFTCAVADAGKVYCWGDNTDGRLGDGTTADRVVPTPVVGITGAVDVGVGQESACALRAGEVLCWGVNTYGQLGDGTTTAHLTPVAVVGLDKTVTELRTTSYGACAATSATLKCWGSNYYAQVGDGTTTNRPTPTQIARGDIPPVYSCVAAWTVVGSRCAPGPTVALTYRVAHTVAGWSPPAPLTLVARP